MKTYVYGLAAAILMMPAVVLAAPTDQIQTAENSLDYTLRTLRQSVEKMTKENQSLSEANEAMRQKIRSMNEELKPLQKEEARVLEQFSSLEARYQKRMEGVKAKQAQVTDLETDLSALDEESKQLSSQVALKENTDADLRARANALEEEIDGLKSGQAVEAPVDEETKALVEERDQLRKQVFATASTLQQARDEWLDLQGLVDAGPNQTAVLQKERDNLNAALASKKEAVDLLKQKLATEESALKELPSAEDISPAKIALLDQEVGVLNEEYRALNQDLGKVTGDQKSRKVSAAFEAEKKKQEDRFKEVADQNRSLRQELNKLRRQMVDLDKKKAVLEKQVYRE